jgi:hypothetical protein
MIDWEVVGLIALLIFGLVALIALAGDGESEEGSLP